MKETLNTAPFKTPPDLGLSLVKPRPNERLITQIEYLLEQAKKGEIVSLFSVAEWSGGVVTSGHMHNGTVTRRVLGELTWLIHDLVDLQKD